MNQSEYLKEFESFTQQMLATTRAKNADYADARDAFANFRAVEHLSNGKIDAFDGIITRMTDKLTRIINLRFRSNVAAVEESIEDSAKDLAVYAVILYLYLKSKGANLGEPIPTLNDPF